MNEIGVTNNDVSGGNDGAAGNGLPPGNEDPPEPGIGIVVDLRIADSVPSSECPLNVGEVTRCIRASAVSRRFTQGEISVLITDDEEIHRINRDHLGHDYPTDVISFGYVAEGDLIEGELVVSVDTARSMAKQHGVSAATELQLYLIHGTLHVAGMDDHQPSDREAMRTAERDVLAKLGNQEFDRLSVDGSTVVSEPSQ